MPVGMQTFNDFGGIQFDTDSTNIVFHSKGNHAVTTGASASPVGTRSILSISGPPDLMVALRPVNTGVVAVIYYVAYDSGTNTKNFYIMCTGGTTVTIDWWAFTKPSSPPSNYGLSVYDSSGVVTYHSFAKPLKLIDVSNESLPTGIGVTIPVGLVAAHVVSPVAGKTFAVIQGFRSGYIGNFSAGGGNYQYRSYYSGVSVRSSDQAILYGEGGPHDQATGTTTVDTIGRTTWGPRNALFVDVTGL